jgi:MFS family permease
VAVAFVANGLGGPSILSRLPELQSDLGLSDASLGLTLAGMALGAMVASPFAGRMVEAVGSRRVVVAATVVLGATLWTAGAAPNAPMLFVALAVIGAADASMDISMNANGAAFEEWSQRSVMHGLHGAWSLGALSAAGLSALAAVTGVPLTVHLVIVGAAIAGGVLATRSGLVVQRLTTIAVEAAGEVAGDGGATLDGATGDASPDRARRRPGRRAVVSLTLSPIVVLAAATVAGAIVEGGASDWSAIQLERLGVATGVSALGFAAFMAGMVVGRFTGDRLTDRLGGATVLRGGMALVAGALVVGVAIDHAAAFAVALFLAGLGAAGFFPLAFSAASRTPGVSPGAGAATVSLAARIGFLVEPVLVGAVAELVGLRSAFVMVAGFAVALAASASRVIPDACRPETVRLVDVREP